MGVSNRNVQVEFSGVTSLNVQQIAAENAISVATQTIVSLTTGANTITVPVVAGLVCTAITIIPPPANTIPMTLKGVTGDTGIALNLVDPTTIAVTTTLASFVLTNGSTTTAIKPVTIIFS
jgi:hypothetical protein